MTQAMGQRSEGAAEETGAGSAAARGVQIAAFCVHVFTACGAVAGMLALQAAVRGNFAGMFAWLGAALVVDGIDGTFARYFRVAIVLPRWSGETLDLVVDFLTYVVVPAYAIYTAGLVPPGLDVVCLAAIVVSSAIYFADRDMKTADYCFRGFPAAWNAAAFYLFLLRPDPWLAAGGIAALVALTFAPVAFVHPMRVRRRRTFHLALVAMWSVLAVTAVAQDLHPAPVVTAALCAIAVLFVLSGLYRNKEK